MEKNVLKEFAEETVSKLQDGIGVGEYASDLHHFCWNEDYFIIGNQKAKEWIEQRFNTFEAIGDIQKYENENFGTVSTDLTSPEKVANMLAYIYGNEVLYCSSRLDECWNSILNEDDVNMIISEIKLKYGIS